MEVSYKIIYNHPNGDTHVSPSLTLKDMDKQCKVPQGTYTEQTFIQIMKDLFKSRKEIRESNISYVLDKSMASDNVYCFHNFDCS